MTREQLQQQISKKKSMLCVGLDTDPDRIPAHLLKEEDPVFAFNKAIIDATHPFAVAYKPNTAFYEAMGVAGWRSLERTINYLNEKHPEVFTIADAKRGDIGNTSSRYAQAFFEELSFDSVTVAPYMGEDSVKPFLEFENKWTIVLGLTSNSGSADFQHLSLAEGTSLFETVLQKVSAWGSPDKLMFVVGATQTEFLEKVRAVIPQHFLLVPGVGAQGGSLEGVIAAGMGEKPNLLINSSRAIIYSSTGPDFAESAGKAARALQKQMSAHL